MSNDSFEYLPGGGVRVSIGGHLPGAQSQPATEDNSIRVVGERQSSADPATVGGGDILGTARNPWGTPVAGANIQGDSRIRVGGMEMTVEIAEMRGLVKRNPSSGLYENVSGAPVDPSSQNTDANDEDSDLNKYAQPQATGVKEADDFVMVASSESPQELEGIAQALIANEDVADADIERMASNFGVEPDSIRDVVEKTEAAFVSSAVKAVEDAFPGIDGEAVLAWAAEYAPDQAREAMRVHWSTKNAAHAGYTQFIPGLFEHIANEDPEGLMAELVKGTPDCRFKLDGKKILVTLPDGTQAELTSAIRSGLFPRKR